MTILPKDKMILQFNLKDNVSKLRKYIGKNK